MSYGHALAVLRQLERDAGPLRETPNRTAAQDRLLAYYEREATRKRAEFERDFSPDERPTSGITETK